MAYLIGLSDATRQPSVWGKAQDSAPTDRQMLTWDTAATRWEYQWPGMTNFSENRTFTILPAGSTIAAINTALTDYDVVYLEPGAYTHAGGASVLTIPQGKKLIGLGDIRPKSSSCGVVFSLTAASTASRYFYLQDGEIQNIYIEIAAAFVATTPIIEGDTTNYRNVVIGVGVRQLLGAILAQYAFYGSFVKIERWTVVDLNGLYLLFAGVAYDEIPSYVSINSFYISGSPGYGLRIGTGVKPYICNGYINVSSGGYGLYSYTTSSTSVYVEAVYSFGTAGGLYFDVSAGNSANVTLVGCIGSASGASSGVYINRGNYCFISDTLGTGGGTGYGFRIENGVQVSLVNCRSSSSPYGFYFNAVTYFSVADSFTSSNTTGFYATGSKGQISSCSTDVCTTGFDITTGCTQVHLTNCRANGGTTGFNFGAPAGVVEQITAKGCTASGCAGNGFFFGTAAGANYLWNSVIADCYAYNCGATTANSSGFYGWLTRSSMTGCLAHSCNAQSGNRSFRLTFIYCTMTGCTGSDATYRNFDFEGGYGNAISGISSWGTTNTPDTNAYGIALSCTYTSMTGWSSYQDFRGVYIGGQNNTISSGNIYNSTDLGFFSANGLAYEAFHDIHVYNCGSHNFYFDNLQQSNVTGLTSEFGSGVGIYFFGTTTDVNISSCFVRGGTTYSFYMAAPNYCNVTGITCCYGATHFRIDGGNFSNFTGIHCFSGTEGIWFNAGTGHLLSASLSTGHSAATNRGIYLRGGNTNYEHGNKALGNTVPRDASNNWTVIDAM